MSKPATPRADAIRAMREARFEEQERLVRAERPKPPPARRVKVKAKKRRTPARG